MARKTIKRRTMKATTLKKKYPEQWESVEASMIGQLMVDLPGLYKELYKYNPKNSKLAAIAHNAAYFACLELHEYIKLNPNER